MAVTSEDGTGVAGADVYGTIAAIDAYWLARPQRAEATAWAAASTGNKEGAAREATAYTDGVWGSFFIGFRASYAQGLQWPRIGGMDNEEDPPVPLPLLDSLDREVPDLPPQLLAAVAELAARALAAPLASDQATVSGIKRERKKVGPIEKEIEYATPTVGQASYGMVMGILAPLLNGSQPGATQATWFWR